MNQFEIYESQGRNQFAAWANSAQTNISHLQFMEDKYDSTDVLYLSGFCSTRAELKTRKYMHTQVWPNQSGFVYEHIKHDALMKSPELDKQFIIIFLDKIVVWDVKEMQREGKLKWKVETLSATHTRTFKKEKLVCYLELEDASHIFDK